MTDTTRAALVEAMGRVICCGETPCGADDEGKNPPPCWRRSAMRTDYTVRPADLRGLALCLFFLGAAAIAALLILFGAYAAFLSALAFASLFGAAALLGEASKRDE